MRFMEGANMTFNDMNNYEKRVGHTPLHDFTNDKPGLSEKWVPHSIHCYANQPRRSECSCSESNRTYCRWLCVKILDRNHRNIIQFSLIFLYIFNDFHPMFHVFRNFAFDFHFNQASQPCFLWHMGLNRMAVERIQPQSVPTSLQNSFRKSAYTKEIKETLDRNTFGEPEFTTYIYFLIHGVFAGCESTAGFG